MCERFPQTIRHANGSVATGSEGEANPKQDISKSARQSSLRSWCDDTPAPKPGLLLGIWFSQVVGYASIPTKHIGLSLVTARLKHMPPWGVYEVRVMPLCMRVVEVLLVEDTTGDAILIRQALAECPVPVTLHIARDGDQALLMLTNPPVQPDLIILDLNIPKITGTALLQRWRVGTTPVVVFSSSANPTEKVRSLALGAREFVSKPMDLDEFTDAVRGIVQRWAMHQGASWN